MPFLLTFTDGLGLIPERTGTREFYSAAAQAIPTLLVAFVLEIRFFLNQLRGFLAMGTDTRLLLIPSFLTLAFGEAVALDVLGCKPGNACATETTYEYVWWALVVGASLVFAVLIAGLFGPDESNPRSL